MSLIARLSLRPAFRALLCAAAVGIVLAAWPPAVVRAAAVSVGEAPNWMRSGSLSSDNPSDSYSFTKPGAINRLQIVVVSREENYGLTVTLAPASGPSDAVCQKSVTGAGSVTCNVRGAQTDYELSVARQNAADQRNVRYDLLVINASPNTVTRSLGNYEEGAVSVDDLGPQRVLIYRYSTTKDQAAVCLETDSAATRLLVLSPDPDWSQVTLNEGEYTIAPSANRGRVHYVVAYNPGSSPLDFTLTAKKRGTAAGSTC